MNDHKTINPEGSAQSGHSAMSQPVDQETFLMNEKARLTSFTRFYETSYPRIFRHLYVQFGHLEQAENLTQEVFLKAWRAWPPTSTEHLSGWLATITMRTAQDERRKNRARPPRQSLEALLGWLDEVSSPLDEAEATLSRLAFRAAWSSLPRRQRMLLVRIAAGATLAQLAQEEGCHRSTIIQRLARARAVLRHRYHKEAEG